MTTGYSAAYQDAAVIERSDRRFVRVFGRDPARMVQGRISNDLARADATRAVYAAVLTPKGKMVCDVRVLRRGDELLLETDAAALQALLDHLKKFVPPLFARFEPASEFWGVLSVYGPNARAQLDAALHTSLPADMQEDDAHATALATNPVLAMATSYVPAGGYDVVAHPDALHEIADQLRQAGVQSLDDAALEVLRVEAGRPRWGAELNENTIPLEANLRERAISESKGCYTGQEVIVRILHRGHVNWLLRGVRLGDIDPPARDAPLLHVGDHRRIGRITSAVRSPQLRETIALAYVRRELEPPAEAHLEAASGPRVAIVALPLVQR